MDKNKFIFLSGGLLFASIGNTVQGQEAVATTERPNVIYLLCDDMGYSDIEAYGQQMISTPNLTYAHDGSAYGAYEDKGQQGDTARW